MASIFSHMLANLSKTDLRCSKLYRSKGINKKREKLICKRLFREKSDISWKFAHLASFQCPEAVIKVQNGVFSENGNIASKRKTPI